MKWQFECEKKSGSMSTESVRKRFKKDGTECGKVRQVIMVLIMVNV